MSSCDWGSTFEAMKTYHDTEWGVPVHDDRKMFEHLTMEAMQCGLSWSLMIKKREIFRKCFDGFDYDKIAAYDESDIDRIMNTDGMIRSQRKIEAVINNARCYQKIRNEHGSFCDWLWAHTDGKTVLYSKHDESYIPVSNGLSDKIAKELKEYGFKYLGTVTVYSHLQACGIINDHAKECPCYRKIIEANPTVKQRRYLEKQIQFWG